MQHPLWTRNFTITTVGTIISLMGNAVTKFALGRVVYDHTQSTLLYSLFLTLSTLPRIVVPLMAGPYLDRVSRRDIIIRVDLFYTFMFLGLALLTTAQVFSYPLYLLIALVLGSADSLYNVAYDSFYPELISPGNFSKAYAIGSLLYPLANTIMVPVANWVYDSAGVAPLFYFNTGAFFLTQWVERKIKVKERHLQPGAAPRQRQSYARDFMDGLRYLRGEKGLLAITGYFFITMLVMAMPDTVLLPFFSSHPVYTAQMYSYLISANTLGRIVGGVFHYRVPLPAGRKYAIALSVYCILSFIQGFLLYVPYPVMLGFMFLNGMLAVTSFNIRTCGTQSHVPDAIRGRFNSLFAMITMGGTLLGQLIAGALGEVLPIPVILLLFQGVNLLAVLAIMVPAKRQVQVVYNQDI